LIFRSRFIWRVVREGVLANITKSVSAKTKYSNVRNLLQAKCFMTASQKDWFYCQLEYVSQIKVRDISNRL
jgi:hypothetical protein